MVNSQQNAVATCLSSNTLADEDPKSAEPSRLTACTRSGNRLLNCGPTGGKLALTVPVGEHRL